MERSVGLRGRSKEWECKETLKNTINQSINQSTRHRSDRALLKCDAQCHNQMDRVLVWKEMWLLMCVEGTKKFAKSRLRRKFWGLIWKAMTGVATLTISVDFFSTYCSIT